MKKVLSYNHSVRLTLHNQGFGWLNTDPSVKMNTVAKIITDHSEQMKALSAGEIEDIDESKPSVQFWAAGKDDVFLGYIKTKYPTTAEILQKVWPKLEAHPIQPV